MEDNKTIWHIELYDEYVGDEYFAREDAARLYIATQRNSWDKQNITYALGGETLWL